MYTGLFFFSFLKSGFISQPSGISGLKLSFPERHCCLQLPSPSLCCFSMQQDRRRLSLLAHGLKLLILRKKNLKRVCEMVVVKVNEILPSPGWSTACFGTVLKKSSNPRMVWAGKDPKAHFALRPWTKLLQAPSNLDLSTSRDGEAPALMGFIHHPHRRGFPPNIPSDTVLCHSPCPVPQAPVPSPLGGPCCVIQRQDPSFSHLKQQIDNIMMIFCSGTR